MKKSTQLIVGLALLALAFLSIVSASSLIWGIGGLLYSAGVCAAFYGLGFCVASGER